MAIRWRAVEPDLAYELQDGETIGVVSEEHLQNEVEKAVTASMLVGGTFSVVQDRHPTGVPHEMVTVRAVIEWKDRTDAKPQAETAAPARHVDIERGPDPEEDQPEFAPQYDTVVNTRTGETFEVVATPGEPMEGITREQLAALNAAAEAGELEDPEPEELEEALERDAQIDEAEESYTPQSAEEAEYAAEREAIPAGAVVMGAPVGSKVTRTPREHGEGVGALPFQRGSTEPTPRPEVNLDEIVHGDTSAPARGAEPAPAGSSEGIDDGFVPEADEDVDAIPENMRD